MPLITVEVTQSTLAVLNRHARDRGRGLKAQNIAAAALEDYVRQSVELDRRFRDAKLAVDKRLGTG